MLSNLCKKKEKLFLKMCKYLLSVNKKTTNIFFVETIYYMLNWKHLEKNCDTLFFCITVISETHEQNKLSWLENIHSILIFNMLIKIFTNYQHLNLKKLFYTIEINYNQIWINKIFSDFMDGNKKNKLRTYNV